MSENGPSGIMGLAARFGAQSFFQLCSAEMFPTNIRSRAQGVTFFVVRVSLGIWSLAVPTLTSYDFTTLTWILTGFLVVSGVIGCYEPGIRGAGILA